MQIQFNRRGAEKISFASPAVAVSAKAGRFSKVNANTSPADLADYADNTEYINRGGAEKIL